MRRTGSYVWGLASMVALAAWPVMAQQGWYAKGAVGIAWTEELDLKQFIGPTSGASVEFDPDIRLDIGGGYRFSDWFAAELETGVIFNYFDRIGGDNDPDDSSLANVPFLINGVFEFPTQSGFVPFIGGGLGFSFTVLELDHVGGVDGDDTDTVFAYQGFAGVRYDINEQWSVSLAYKYFGTSDPSWDVHHISGEIELEGAHTHAVMAGFSYHF